MLYLYDDALVDDLRNSFNVDATSSPVVCVVPPENIIDIAAQVQNDDIHFPLIAVAREKNIPVNNNLNNFTRMHTGVATVFNKEKNELYYEKSIPLNLEYTLVCMSTNTADVDELIRELIFKYTTQYFLTIHSPYESKRKIRFGIRIDPDEEIEWYNTTAEYLDNGSLHSAGIKLHVDGAVLLTYTPVKLQVSEVDIDVE